MRDLIQKNNSWLKIEQKVDFDGSKKEFCVQNQLWTKVKPKQFYCIENEKTDFFSSLQKRIQRKVSEI